MTATTPEVLERLDGWKTTPPTATGYDVTGAAIISTITNAEIKASAYIGNYAFSTPTDVTYFDNAVADWAAGLLYNRRETMDTMTVNVDQEYGQTLITQAKETLNLLKEGDTNADDPQMKKRETELLAFAYKWDKDTLNNRIDTSLIYPDNNTDDEDW